MENNINNYIEFLTDSVYKQMCCNLNLPLEYNYMEVHFNEHFNNEKNIREHFKNFQEYYFQSINNEKLFLSPNFLDIFRQKYSLQGIDKIALQNLENKKVEILKLIRNNNLSMLYSDHFAKVKIKQKDSYIEKNLGSFFTKIAHTFKPEEYCPIDNPIKNFFKLESESYFVALIVISKAFSKWAKKNRNIMDKMKTDLIDSIKTSLDLKKIGKFDDKITDQKILNIIFWSLANQN